MRKRYKNKRKSCALCKPHKRGFAVRWRARELANIVRAEREAREGDARALMQISPLLLT